MRNIILALQILVLYSLLSIIASCKSAEQATFIEEDTIAVANATPIEKIETIEETALTLSGQVSLPSGDPLYEAEVSVIGTTELVLTNEDGSFSITTDADLPIQLNINYPGFYPEEIICLLYTSPSPRDATLSRMPSSA